MRKAIITVLLTATLVTGCQGRQEDPGGPQESPAATERQEQPTSPAAQPERSAVVALEFGQAAVRVQVVDLKEHADGRVVVTLKVTNVGKMPANVTLTGDLEDQQGRRFSDKGNMLNDMPELLNPTESGRGVLRFILPSGAEPKVLYVWDGVNPGEPVPLMLPA